jgi:hypothetical protein
MAADPRFRELPVTRNQHGWVPWLLALAMLIAAAAILHQGRGTLPFFDEWNFIIERRGHSLDTLLRPHNGHLVVAPLLLYKLLLQIAGLTDYWVFRAVLVGLHLLVGLGVFAIARRRVGDVGALVAAALVLFCFAAADDLLWAFQISFLLAMAFGVWMLVGLDRNSLGGDLLACVCLAGALASAAIGLPFAVTAIVIVGADKRRLQRAWVVAIPLVLFALWYLAYGVSELKLGNAQVVPRFAAEMASNAAGGLVGLGIEYGRPLALTLAAAVAFRLATPRRATPWLIAVVLTAVAIWALTALARGDIGEPLAPRYIYPGAVLIVLIVVELLRGRRLATSAAPVALLLVCLAGLANYATLGAFAAGLRGDADALEARLGALALVGTAVPDGFQAVPREAPVITPRGALESQRDFGAIGLSASALASASANQRAAADSVLISAGQVTVGRASTVSGSAPKLLLVRNASAVPEGGCTRIVPRRGGSSSVDVELPAGSALALRSSALVPVFLRRFGDGFAAKPSLVIPASKATLLQARADSAEVTWTVALKPSAPLKVCTR